MNVLTNTVDYTKPYTGFFEALEFGGQMVLIGMVAVFAVLGLIWAMLTLFKLVFSKKNSKVKEIAPKAPIPVVSSAPATSDGEIVAVIAAAVAMAESESGNSMKFRVVSFRKK